jgi:hypothetical protein
MLVKYYSRVPLSPKPRFSHAGEAWGKLINEHRFIINHETSG